jgi:predicted MPP superfamily phosphohydrolase
MKKMKAIWLNDIHFEFLGKQEIRSFIRSLAGINADAVLIGGDIGQAPTVSTYLSRLEDALAVPIYFVLGNHDYYHGSIAEVRSAIGDLVRRSSDLHWLTENNAVLLTPNTCLVGHDGWGDGRLGDYEHSLVQLNDFRLISELTGLSRSALLGRLNQLGDEAAAHIGSVLSGALQPAEHVVVLTHVPPFKEASWYNGQHCERDWLPFFSCQAVGDVLAGAMRNHPHKRMTVLCGHTHGGGSSEILPNLVTYTGPAEYGRPAIQKVFEWD